MREFKHVMLVNNATFHDSISRVYRSVGRFPAPRSSQFERDSLSLDLTEFMGELNARTVGDFDSHQLGELKLMCQTECRSGKNRFVCEQS